MKAVVKLEAQLFLHDVTAICREKLLGNKKRYTGI